MCMTPLRSRKVKGQGHHAAKRRDQQSAISSERKGLRTSNLVYRWSTMTRITDMSGDFHSESCGSLFKSPLAGTGHIVAAHRQTNRQTDWLTDWLNNWLIDWLIDKQTNKQTNNHCLHALLSPDRPLGNVSLLRTGGRDAQMFTQFVLLYK